MSGDIRVKRFMIVTFGLLGWTFYVFSGGADYVPKDGSRQAVALLKAQADQSAPAIAAVQAQPATSIAPDMLVKATMTADARPAVATIQPMENPPLNDLPDARVASLTLTNPDAFAQAAGYAPLSEEAEAQSATATDAFQRLADLRQITAARANIRNGPGTGYGVVGQAARGTEVEVLDGLPSGWLQLRVRDSQQIGWVATSLVSGSEG